MGFGGTLITLITHPLTPKLMETYTPVLAWKKKTTSTAQPKINPHLTQGVEM